MIWGTGGDTNKARRSPGLKAFLCAKSQEEHEVPAAGLRVKMGKENHCRGEGFRPALLAPPCSGESREVWTQMPVCSTE